MTFRKWFKKRKLTRTAYLTSELKQVFEDCWNKGFSDGMFYGFFVGGVVAVVAAVLVVSL